MSSHRIRRPPATEEAHVATATAHVAAARVGRRWSVVSAVRTSGTRLRVLPTHGADTAPGAPAPAAADSLGLQGPGCAAPRVP